MSGGVERGYSPLMTATHNVSKRWIIVHNGDDGENDVGNDGGGRKGAGEGLENYKPCPFNA